MQQEHISKSDTNPLASPFDDLDEEHVAGLKKKNTKIIGSIVERFQELYDHLYVLDKNLFISAMVKYLHIFMNATYYDDPTKDHSGPAACQ
ncbi:unnamed protein product, partial [Rotaria magnacalcarata]